MPNYVNNPIAVRVAAKRARYEVAQGVLAIIRNSEHLLEATQGSEDRTTDALDILYETRRCIREYCQQFEQVKAPSRG